MDNHNRINIDEKNKSCVTNFRNKKTEKRFRLSNIYLAIYLIFSGPFIAKTFADETEVKIGGFVKISAAATTNGVSGVGDASGLYNVDLLYADASKGMRFGYDARETRIHLTLQKHDTPIGPAKIYIESNFAGEGSTNGNANETYGNNMFSLVLRHSYLELNHVLIGQTFSTFSDLSILSNILDGGGYASTVFSRNPQIRYTQPIDDFTLRFSLENPSSTFEQNNVTDDQRFPDLIARVDYDPEWGHFSIAGVIRELRIETNEFEAHKITGGISATITKEIIPGALIIKAQYMYGTIGQYGLSAGFADGLIVVDEHGKHSISPVIIRGATIGATINWSSRFKSILLGSWAKSVDKGINQQTFGTGKAIENVWSLNANFFYNLSEDFTVGMEYKKMIGNLSDNTKANVDRLQASIIYTF